MFIEIWKCPLHQNAVNVIANVQFQLLLTVAIHFHSLHAFQCIIIINFKIQWKKNQMFHFQCHFGCHRWVWKLHLHGDLWDCHLMWAQTCKLKLTVWISNHEHFLVTWMCVSVMSDHVLVIAKELSARCTIMISARNISLFDMPTKSRDVQIISNLLYWKRSGRIRISKVDSEVVDFMEELGSMPFRCQKCAT